MDSILHYTSVSHAGSLMACINKLRVNADLCDVTVVVGNYRILAHKIILSASSPFFYKMLKIDSRPASSDYNEVLLDSVDEIAALKIIEFCYTSAISLDDDTVWPLLEAAIKFQFAEICSLCSEFLTAGLDVSNCILCLRLAARLNFSQLEDNCIRFLKDNLQKSSKSQSLVMLSPQELSSVLSILDAHGTQRHMTATLAQAWLNWNRDSRADFLPKLKLLLPAIGDLVQKCFHDGAYTIPNEDSPPLADTETICLNENESNFQRGFPTDQYDSVQSHTSVLNSESGTELQKSSRVFTLNGPSKDSTANTDKRSDDMEWRNTMVKRTDYICVSCGDEFECITDLNAHGRLCNESVQILKSVNGTDQEPKSTPSPFSQDANCEKIMSKMEHKSVENISDCNQETASRNCSIIEDSINAKTAAQSDASSEASYHKTRRSLRSHKLEEKCDDTAEQKTITCLGEGSLSDDKDSKSESYNPLCKSPAEAVQSEVDDLSKENEKRALKAEDDMEEQRSLEIRLDIDASKDSSNGHVSDPEEETTRDHALSMNDNNNNDVLLRNTGSHNQSTSPVAKDEKTSDDVTASRDKSVFQNSSSHKENQNICKYTEIDLKEEVLDNRGPLTLRQWRQEHQNSSPTDPFPESSPKHKCLICSRVFWDRKILANHWKQNHGVRSLTNEEEEHSWSDHEPEQKAPTASKRKRQSPKHAYLPPQSISSSSDGKQLKAGHCIDIHSNVEVGTSTQNSDTDLISDLPTDQTKRGQPGSLKIKQEIFDGNSGSVSMEPTGNYNKYDDSGHSSQLNLSEGEHSQMPLKQPLYEGINNDPSQSLNPSVEQWMRGALWQQENPENIGPGPDVISSSKAPQNLNAATSEFLANYINQYNKLAEWCMAQGSHFCPACMRYHPFGKSCPNAVTQNSTESSTDHGKGEMGAKHKEAKEVEMSKGDDEDEGPLDMSKSSADFSIVQTSHSASGSSSSKSSSVNSSGHSSILGASPFFNYNHLMSDSDVLDMSISRYGDGKFPADLALPLKKSPLDPNASFSSPFSAFHPQFSTAPALSSPSAGPSSSTTPISSSTMSSLPKPSNGARKKASSRQGFPCTVCNRVFSYQTALFTHMHTHSPSARSYRCQLCNETFARAPDLKVHVCPNGLEKPYSCPSCGQTFAKNIHLKRHLATHSGLKPYPCWVCGKRFSRSDHLKRHTQSIHAGARPHVCHVCGKEFVRKYELNKHMQSHEQTFVVT